MTFSKNHVEMINKIERGQFFTVKNPFNNEGFLDWAKKCDLKNTTILEPFAGSNNLIEMLKDMDLCSHYQSYDIQPKSVNVKYKNTLEDFPRGFDCCITNPPYLAKNSATRKQIDVDMGCFDDLYKYSLSKCLKNCKHVGAIIPASFINAGIFRDRLSCYILLTAKMFDDTDTPVCLALFDEFSSDTKIYEGSKFLGSLSELEKKTPRANNTVRAKFNDGRGQLGLIAIDNTQGPTIRFCRGEEISADKIKVSSRSITRIEVGCKINDSKIQAINDLLDEYRRATYDVLMTPFKGIREDGKFRRRLDYALADTMICKCFG